MTIHQAKAARLSSVGNALGGPSDPKRVCAEGALESGRGELTDLPRPTLAARFEPARVPEVERRRAHVIQVGYAVRSRTYAVSGTDIAAKIISAHKK